MKYVNKSSVNLQLGVLLALFIATTVCGFVSLQAYIGNSKEAKKRYDALIAVDAAGGDVEKSLLELRTYIYQHANTTIGSPTGIRPPIQLKGTYDRLVAAEKARVKAANDDLYNKAQKECERLYPEGLSGKGRIPCITEYVTKNAVSEQVIPDALYKYDFASPVWAPDSAGFGMIATILLAATTLFMTFTYVRVRHNSHMSS